MTGSIKFLQFFQKCHQLIGIHPSQPNQKRYPINWARIIILIGCAGWMLTTGAFLVIEAKSMFDYGFGFSMLITSINCIIVYLILIWKLENILKFIGNCEGFIETRLDSTADYKKLFDKIELCIHYLFMAVSITYTLLFSSVLPYSYVRYYLIDMGQKSFYLFIPVWFPFDWKTPAGYLVAWLAQSIGAAAMAINYIIFLSLVFGSGWLFIFMAKDITQDVAAFNIDVKIKKSDKNCAKLTKRICDMVQIYSDAKGCIMEFNQIVNYSLLEFFLWNMLGISSLPVTLQFQLWTDGTNSFEIGLLLIVLLWAITFNFMLCEPGERMTNQFVGLSDELSQCNWYTLPIEIKRIYMVFLSDTQNPVKMSSYANITCERETFKKIIKTAFSYFMTMRRFRT